MILAGSNRFHVVNHGHLCDVIRKIRNYAVNYRVKRGRVEVDKQDVVLGIKATLHIDGEEFENNLLDLELTIKVLVGAGAKELGNHRYHMFMHIEVI